MTFARAILGLLLAGGCFAKPDRPDGVTEDAIPGDAAPRPPPEVAIAVSGSAGGGSGLTYNVTIPDGVDRYLLVSVQLGTSCDPPSPDVAGVRFGNQPLERVASIVGTPCDAAVTRSEQWQLIGPSTGSHAVVVMLSSTASSIHSSALALTGVDQVAPVRASAATSGAGTVSAVTVDSAPDDLVVDTIGQGRGIVSPGPGQTQRLLNNVDSSNTLNNSAASTAPGAPSVTMTWQFDPNPDEWQTIATSVRP